MIVQPGTADYVRHIINQDQEVSPPKRRKILTSESKAFIRDAKQLIARCGLYQELKPYREQYTSWQYRFLCHLIISSQQDILDHGDLPGVPIPWTAIEKCLPSMTGYDLREIIEHGLMSRDYYDQADHKCY